VLSDGDSVPADLVVIAVGVAPRVSLARQAGLEVDNGVLVDAQLRTSDPNIYAVGDIANHDHPLLGHRLRVEHWDNAIEQGKVAARNMLGEGIDYQRMPYFFTDQYDLGMEYVGHTTQDQLLDTLVVRGDLAARKATVLWHDHGRVLAGMHINTWEAVDPLRAVVGRQLDVTRLEDTRVPLAELAGAAT
jgi:NADPH-dependent 2,4-dienoyl-CoA reductase/sulfur reductase-like enzyme